MPKFFQSKSGDRRSTRLRWLMRCRRLLVQKLTMYSESWFTESSRDWDRRSTMKQPSSYEKRASFALVKERIHHCDLFTSGFSIKSCMKEPKPERLVVIDGIPI